MSDRDVQLIAKQWVEKIPPDKLSLAKACLRQYIPLTREQRIRLMQGNHLSLPDCVADAVPNGPNDIFFPFWTAAKNILEGMSF
jgi:hypothetical protein